MNKFMTFNATVQNAFNNDENDYKAFNKLLVDAYKGTVADFSAKEANDKIVEIFRKVIGCDENSTQKEIRKAIRRNQCDKAVQFINSYEIPFVLQDEIKDINAQMNFSESEDL